MKHQILLWGAAAAVLLTGCIDDHYDLSDVDTTSEFKVNNLVLPLNLEPVVLRDIIKVKEGDQLDTVTINGKTFYAVQQSGEFHSDGIDVSSFTAEAGTMNDQTAVFRPESQQDARRRAAGSETYLLIRPVYEDLTYEASGIDGSIRDLTRVNFKPIEFAITISTSGIPAGVESQLDGVYMYIPKGLDVTRVIAGGHSFGVSAYDASTGALTLADSPIPFTRSGEVCSTIISLTVDGVDLASYDGAFRYDPESNSGSFRLNSSFNIENARLDLSNLFTPVGELSYNVHYEMGSIDATSVLGSIEYDLSGTGLDIKPIDLSSIPDFLDDPETNLVLSNPQIYLKLMNPIGKYGLPYQSGLDIVANRPGGDRSFVSPTVKVPGRVGEFNFLLSPVETSDIPEDYRPLTSGGWLRYADLGEILSGDGLPKTLDIELVDPMIPQNPVTAPFELNQTIQGMEGTYMFLAPLSLKGRKVVDGQIVEEGSEIVKTVDGWWSEDLSDLNIDYLTISADATNGLSTGVILSVYAIDREGRQISTEGTLVLPYGAAADAIEITLEGFDGQPFNDLDGIRLYVIAGENDSEPLAPGQTIYLENIRAKVSGNYTRKL